MIRSNSSSCEQRLGVRQGVGVVGVGHERGLRPQRVAHRAHVLDIGAGLDLELHLAVALLQREPGPLDQRVG